jgi:hypothetical protein
MIDPYVESGTKRVSGIDNTLSDQFLSPDLHRMWMIGMIIIALGRQFRLNFNRNSIGPQSPSTIERLRSD